MADCTIPPPGWHCTRGAGHTGPCAAVPACAARKLSAEEIQIKAREILRDRGMRAEHVAVCVRAGLCPKDGSTLIELESWGAGSWGGVVLRRGCQACFTAFQWPAVGVPVAEGRPWSPLDLPVQKAAPRRRWWSWWR